MVSIRVVRETLHIMDDMQRIALVETRTEGVDASPPQLVRYQFGNHIGSASLELDDLARIISYEEYTPYGSTSYQIVNNQTEVPKRYRYTGKERDEETGLGYHGARYYAPWLGRWTACDPFGIDGGMNSYVYAGNSPSRLIDANGAEPFDPQKGHWFRKWLLYRNDTPILDAITNDKNLGKCRRKRLLSPSVAHTCGSRWAPEGLGCRKTARRRSRQE